MKISEGKKKDLILVDPRQLKIEDWNPRFDLGDIEELKNSIIENGVLTPFVGYKEGDFEEYHYKVVTVAKSKAEAIKKAKKTTFFKHCGFTDSGETHIDDKYGIDVDDIHKIEDILAVQYKSKYQLKITITNTFSTDEKHIGYLALTKLKK